MDSNLNQNVKKRLKFEVSKHFNYSTHELDGHFKFCIFKNDIVSLDERLYMENDLINKLLKAKITVINDYIPEHNRCKQLCFN